MCSWAGKSIGFDAFGLGDSHNPVQSSDCQSSRDVAVSLPISAQHKGGQRPSECSDDSEDGECLDARRVHGVLSEHGRRKCALVHERRFKSRQQERALTGIRVSHASHSLSCAHAACDRQLAEQSNPHPRLVEPDRRAESPRSLITAGYRYSQHAVHS
jgi:hypothetical protein